MGITVEQFVAELGWDIDSTEFKKFQGQIKDVSEDLKRLGKWIATGTAAILGISVATNEATAEQYRLAQAVGASAETLEALNFTVSGLGFGYGNLVDLIEETSNKLGELKGLGEMTSATDSLKLLNLEFKELKDLSPEEQFIRIFDAAKNLSDQQTAVSAVDMLMGGEANKILGFLRTQEGSLSDLVERYKQLAILTEDGRKGALRFSNEWRSLTLVGKSLVQQFSGELGEALSPLVKDTVDWAVANKELIRTKLKEWAGDLASLIRDARDFVKGLNDEIQQLGGYETIIKRVGLAFAAWKLGEILAALDNITQGVGDVGKTAGKASGGKGLLGGLLNLLGLSGAAGGLGKGALKAGVVGALGAFIVGLGQDIYTTINGGKGAFEAQSKWLENGILKLEEYAAAMAGVPVDEFRAALLSIPDVVSSAYDTADKAAMGALNSIAEQMYQTLVVIDNFGNDAPKMLSEFSDSAKRVLFGLGSDIVDWIMNLGTRLNQIVSDLLGGNIVRRINDFGSSLRSLFGVGQRQVTNGSTVPILPAPSNHMTSTVTNDNRSFSLAPSTVFNSQAQSTRDFARQVDRIIENRLNSALEALSGE